MRTGSGTAHGSVGELMQGFTSSGEPFHVTAPAGWTSTCHVTVADSVTEAAALRGRDTAVGCKAAAAARLAAVEAGVDRALVAVTSVTSTVPVGRGCASSTADVLAAVRAVADAADVPLTASVQARLASQVESSDGLAYPGVAAVNQQTGALLRALPRPPAFELVVVLPEQTLDTAQVRFDGKDAAGRIFDRLLVQLVQATAAGDLDAFGDVATSSALLNQAWNPNPLVPWMLARAGDVDAVGLLVAHTGTAAAWLLRPSLAARADRVADALAADVAAGRVPSAAAQVVRQRLAVT